MKIAFKSVYQILFIGFFKLPIRVWLNSKNKLIKQYHKKGNIYKVLDDEYMATNWLDWAIDCIIFLIYPFGFLFFIIVFFGLLIFGEADFNMLFILLGLIPVYFSPIFISITREVGGSLMLLHINVKKIEKYIKNK